MAATDSLQLKTMSAVQMWLGMLAPGGSPKGRLLDEKVCSQVFSPTSTPREFSVVRQDAKNKCISSSDGAARFCLHKVDMPHTTNQYQWSLSDSQGNFTDSLMVKTRCNYHVAALERNDGSLLASLHQGGFYTLNKFRWGSKTYRWTTSGCAVSRSTMQIRLLEDGSQQELALFSGPGTKCKSYWIQNPELLQETITLFGRTDYPAWVQIVILSGMVAAKTQRRNDKGFQSSYY